MKTETIFRGLFSFAIATALTLPALGSSAKPLPQATEKTDKKAMHDKLQEAVNDLNLSDDQKTKVKGIFTDAKSKREAIWNDTSLSDAQKKAKTKELHADTMAKVNEVLTPEQRSQLKEKLEAAKTSPSMY